MVAVPERPDRRSHPRLALKGTVVVRAGEIVMHARLVDLARGGLFARSQVIAPPKLLGRRAAVELRLDDRRTTWMRLEGEVVRIAGAAIALRFDEVPAEFGALVDALQVASQRGQRTISVLIVDDPSRRRDAISDGFRALGCTVVEAATPLDAIVRMCEAQFEVEVVAIADSNPPARAAELRDFIAREHATARIVAITDSAVAPPGLSRWVSGVLSGSDLVDRLRSLLG
jgi:CheY-like chemotaxis protein